MRMKAGLGGIIGIMAFFVASAGAGSNYLELGKTSRSPKVIVIAPVGTPIENGALLLYTINEISPAQDDWHLIRLAPGKYDIGEQVLQLKSYLILEGSGEICTFIVGSTTVNGVISGATNTELRRLSVTNTNVSGNAAALYYSTTQKPTRIYRVSAEAAGGNGISAALFNFQSSITLEFFTANAIGYDTNNYGIYNIGGADTEIKHAKIKASSSNGEGYGVYNDASDIRINDGDIIVTFKYTNNYPDTEYIYGIYNHNGSNLYVWDSHISGALGTQSDNSWAVLNTDSGGRVEIDQSDLLGGTNSIRNDNAEAYVAVGGSKILGWVKGDVHCAGNYYQTSATYSFYADTCPTAP